MNDDEVKEKIRRATDFEAMAFQWYSIYAKTLYNLAVQRDAAEHGESPEWKKVFDMSKNERYIENLLLFENALRSTVIDFAIANNRNLLDIVEGLISQRCP